MRVLLCKSMFLRQNVNERLRLLIGRRFVSKYTTFLRIRFDFLWCTKKTFWFMLCHFDLICINKSPAFFYFANFCAISHFRPFLWNESYEFALKKSKTYSIFNIKKPNNAIIYVHIYIYINLVRISHHLTIFKQAQAIA